MQFSLKLTLDKNYFAVQINLKTKFRYVRYSRPYLQINVNQSPQLLNSLDQCTVLLFGTCEIISLNEWLFNNRFCGFFHRQNKQWKVCWLLPSMSMIKTRHLHFLLKLCLRKSTTKDTIKTEHMLLPLGRNILKLKLLQFLRQPCCDQNCFPAFEMRTALIKNTAKLLHYPASFLLLQFTGDWNTNLDIGLPDFLSDLR